ncbi:MAG: DUF1320 domain-containing protein [Rhodocyclaceae bacterium]|nr:DUF1320 domain-containing protein [Rhodocyclaceae bacterium]
MAYATRADLEDRHGAEEMEQRESMLPAGAVAGALADADAEIDSYLAARYPLPLATVPALLTRIACAIARYNLLGEAASERARADVEDARRQLARLANGSVTLGLPAATEVATSAGGVAYESSDSVFDAGTGF